MVTEPLLWRDTQADTVYGSVSGALRTHHDARYLGI